MYPPVLSGPDPPTGVSADVTGNDTAVVSWVPSMSRMCDALIVNYSVRYQAKNASGDYTIVYSSNTSVVLRGLVPKAEYTVSVAAINSIGNISVFSDTVYFTVTPSSKPHSNYFNFAYVHILYKSMEMCMFLSLDVYSGPHTSMIVCKCLYI